MEQTKLKSSKPKAVMLMTEGSIFKNILFFSIPLIFGNLLQQMYNAADSVIVGKYVGSNALAAVGASTSLIYLLIAFSQGASVGAGVIVSQCLGAKDEKGVHSAVHTALAISVILGAILTAGGIALSRPLLVAMGTPKEVLDDAVCYLQIYSGGMIFNVIYNMAAGILNAVGNSKKSLVYLAAAALTNIAVDILLIAGFNMGVAGAAIATDLSQAVSSILAIGFLIRVNAEYKVRLSDIHIHKSTAWKMIKIGFPTGIQNMVISLSNMLVQSSVNAYGSVAMAGFGAYMKVDGFNILPVMSFSMAITTFVGQNYGAGKLERMKKGMWVTIAMGFCYTVITGILLICFSETVMRMFTDDADVIAYGQLAISYFCPFYWVLSVLHAVAGTVRGTGKSIPPMVVLLVSLCLFRIVWIKLVLPYFTAIDGIFVLYPVSWAFGAVLMILYAWKGKWIEKV